ncbi:hypothetical protein FACS1894181_15090 [Bacteroidia bacterium]|nr:hypothetical protein FACS1894181_15090 [Bacteroidia bacterium]
MKKITIKERLLIACIIVGAIVSAIGFYFGETDLGVLATFFTALAALIEAMLHLEEKKKEAEAKEREREIQEQIAQDAALKQGNALIDMDEIRRNTGEILGHVKNNQDTQKLIALQEEQIESLKQQLAGKDLPDYMEKAKPYVEEKNFEKAIESIDTEKILNVAEKAKEDLEKAADQLIFKAQLYIANFQFPEAEAHYKQAADIFPSYYNNFAAASFFQDLNRFKEAEDYYTRCLNQATSPEDRATVLNNLGNVQRALNDYPQAEASYTEALQTYRELAAKNPQAYLPYVAMTLNNLGILHWNNNNYPQAEASYTEALQTYKDLAEKNPQAYQPYVATTLNNLGILQSDNNNYPQAEASYTEALQIYRELAATNPQAYLPYVATALNNLGVLYRKTNNYPQAEASYAEALKTYRELAAKNPQAYLPYVAMTLNNLGALHWNNNNYPQAEASYAEALQIRRELAGTNPQAYLPDLGCTLGNLSELYKDGIPNKTLSLQYANEAIEVLNRCNDTPFVQELRKGALKVIAYWKRKN